MTHTNTDTSQYRDWILNWLGSQLDVDSHEIKTDENLLTYGMDSITAIMLVGDLENKYRLRLPPTLVWDQPTVDSIVQMIAPMVAPGAIAFARSGDVRSIDGYHWKSGSYGLIGKF